MIRSSDVHLLCNHGMRSYNLPASANKFPKNGIMEYVQKCSIFASFGVMEDVSETANWVVRTHCARSQQVEPTYSYLSPSGHDKRESMPQDSWNRLFHSDVVLGCVSVSRPGLSAGQVGEEGWRISSLAVVHVPAAGEARAT